MTIIDHGAWERYTPDELPKLAPAGAMFSRRVSDGQDWYKYVHPIPSDGVTPLMPSQYFNVDSVKFTAIWNEENQAYVVNAAVYEAERLFPQNQIVVEITNYTGADPQADLGNKLYNPIDQSFRTMPPPKPVVTETETKILNALDAIMARLDKLEKGGKK